MSAGCWLRCAVSNGIRTAHAGRHIRSGRYTISVQRSQETPEQFGKIIRKQHEDHSIEKVLRR